MGWWRGTPKSAVPFPIVGKAGRDSDPIEVDGGDGDGSGGCLVDWENFATLSACGTSRKEIKTTNRATPLMVRQH